MPAIAAATHPVAAPVLQPRPLVLSGSAAGVSTVVTTTGSAASPGTSWRCGDPANSGLSREWPFRVRTAIGKTVPMARSAAAVMEAAAAAAGAATAALGNGGSNKSDVSGGDGNSKAVTRAVR